MDTPRDEAKPSKVRAIRKDVVIEDSSPKPIPELVEEVKWLYNEALSGNLRELAYAASDMGLEPIYNIVGDSVNYPMLYSTLEVVKQKYFEDIVAPTIRYKELQEIEE